MQIFQLAFSNLTIQDVCPAYLNNVLAFVLELLIFVLPRKTKISIVDSPTLSCHVRQRRAENAQNQDPGTFFIN